MSTIDQIQRIDSACLAYDQAWTSTTPLTGQLLERLASAHHVQDLEELLAELLVLEWQQFKALDSSFQPESARAHWVDRAEAFDKALLAFQVHERLAQRQRCCRTSAQLATGVLLGPYRICSRIGAGGMGDVYAAEDTRLGRKVAIKILASHLTQNPAFVKRFAREAATVARLSHPNIVTLFDLGEVEVGGQTISFVVMEYLEGETLREHIEQNRMSIQRSIQVAIEIAAALEASHRQSIVHRDIKPENIFLTDDGRVKILDFGLARLVEEALAEQESTTSGDALTQVGSVLGTTGYMSPEQVRGEAVCPPSDLFSLTAVTFEMLFGQRAFPGQSRADIASATLRDDPLEQMAESNLAQLSPAVVELLQLGLAKQVDQRLQSAHEYSRRLVVIAADLTNAQRALVEHNASLVRPTRAFGALALRWPGPHPFTPLTVTLGALIALAGVVWSYVIPRSTEPDSGQSQTIAVLPFVSPSHSEGAPDSRNFTVALTDALASHPGLCVRPYSAVSAWKWDDQSNLFDDPRVKRLKAESWLTGQVSLEESMVRVRVELVNAAKGRLVWSRSYIAPQSEIASLHLSIRDDVMQQLGGRSMATLNASSLACGF